MVRIEAYVDSIVVRTRSLSDFINGIDPKRTFIIGHDAADERSEDPLRTVFSIAHRQVSPTDCT